MTPPARLRTVVLDCPDPLALAEFYRSLIGGEVDPRRGRARLGRVRARAGATLRLPAGGRLRPAHLARRRPAAAVPHRPDRRRHRGGRARGAGAGGARHEVQPGEADGDTFRVYLDPVGHPFCLCWD